MLGSFSTRYLASTQAFQMVSHDHNLREQFFTVAAATVAADTA